MKNPVISIIVPVYNVELYLKRCIDSILVQTFTNFELILINDGSTDTSGEICDCYASKDDRIRVIHKDNGGLTSARNMGLDAAKGEYIGFVDSDDWIDPVMYSELYRAMREYDVDISGCSYKIYNNVSDFIKPIKFTPGMVTISELTLEDYLCSYFLPYKHPQDVIFNLYKTSIIKNHNIRRIELNYGADMFFNLYYFNHINKIYCTDKCYYNYFMRDGSIVRTNKKNPILDKYLNALEDYKNKLKELGIYKGRMINVYPVIACRILEIPYIRYDIYNKEESRKLSKDISKIRNLREARIISKNILFNYKTINFLRKKYGFKFSIQVYTTFFFAKTGMIYLMTTLARYMENLKYLFYKKDDEICQK